MKNKLIIALGAALFAVSSAVAIPITGSLDMSGTATLDNTFLGAATKATAFTGVFVGGEPSGSYTLVPAPGGAVFGLTPVTWKPFGWNPSTVPVISLWSFTVGAWTYTFDLLNVSVASQSNSFLNLLGSGVLKITGVGSPYDPTPGTWSFTISNDSGAEHANFKFTFANAQTAAGVPEGGSTLVLLGLALSGVGLLRRKFLA